MRCFAIVILVGLGLGGVTGAAGCSGGSSAPKAPQVALREYAQALSAGNTRQAYDLLSGEARATLSYERFDELAKSSPDQAKSLAAAVDAGPAETRITALVTAPNGESLLLVLEDGEWRLDESVVDPYSQTNPRAALYSFVRAFKQSRYDVLLRLAPGEDRGALSPDALREAWQGERKAELQRLIAALEAALPSTPIEVEGDRARMNYGTAGEAALIREGGLWKIEELK